MEYFKNPSLYANIGGALGTITAQQLAQPDQPADNLLNQHEKMLTVLLGQIENGAQRVTALADRLFGSVPQSVGANEKSPADPPAIRRLENLMSIAHTRVNALLEGLVRLERL